MKQISIPGVLLLFYFVSCKQLFAQSALPETWTDDMELKITYGGGMRYYSSELVIRANGAYSLVNEEGRIRRTELNFSRRELNELLQVLREQAFDQLKSEPRKGIIYDKGTTTTQLSWNQQVSGVSIGSSTFLPDRFNARYQAVRAEVDRLLASR